MFSLLLKELFFIFSFEQSFWKIFSKIYIKTHYPKNESHNDPFLRCITVPMSFSNDPFFTMHHSSNVFFPHANVSKKVSQLVICTLWTCISGFEYLGTTLTSAVTILIGTWWGRKFPKNCFESSSIEENCFIIY